MSKVIVGIIKQNKDNREAYLLVNANKDWGEYTDHYYPPGGHIEEGETKEHALIREIKEELNLEIMPVKELAQTSGDVEDQITYWWSCDLLGGELSIDRNEIKDVGYFTQEEIQHIKIWPATLKFFNDYIFSK